MIFSIALLLFAGGALLFAVGAKQWGQRLMAVGLVIAFILPGILIALHPAIEYVLARPWIWVCAGVVLLLLTVTRVSGNRPRSGRTSNEAPASPKRRVDLPMLHAGTNEGDEE